eukprot:6466369-Amphidinium_carterae.2
MSCKFVTCQQHTDNLRGGAFGISAAHAAFLEVGQRYRTHSSRTAFNPRRSACRHVPSEAWQDSRASLLKRRFLSICAAVCTGTLWSRRAVAAEASADARQRRLTALRVDVEVLELRKIQSEVMLYDVGASRLVTLGELLQKGQRLREADLVCVGELHDSTSDHAIQRLLLDALACSLFTELRSQDAATVAGNDTLNQPKPQNLSPQKLALGVEYFTRQQQETLDGLIFGAGPKTGAAFKEAVGWETVWNYDWSLYSPLFRFCQLNLTRIVGLNIPFEGSMMVSKGGVEQAPEWLQELLPPLDRSNDWHRRRFEDMFKMPLEAAVQRMRSPLDGWSRNPNLDRFYDAQVLWDEYMAETAELYLARNGGRM